MRKNVRFQRVNPKLLIVFLSKEEYVSIVP